MNSPVITLLPDDDPVVTTWFSCLGCFRESLEGIVKKMEVYAPQDANWTLSQVYLFVSKKSMEVYILRAELSVWQQPLMMMFAITRKDPG